MDNVGLQVWVIFESIIRRK